MLTKRTCAHVVLVAELATPVRTISVHTYLRAQLVRRAEVAGRVDLQYRTAMIGKCQYDVLRDKQYMNQCANSLIRKSLVAIRTVHHRNSFCQPKPLRLIEDGQSIDR